MWVPEELSSRAGTNVVVVTEKQAENDSFLIFSILFSVTVNDEESRSLDERDVLRPRIGYS